jgi:hypothetical protein
VNGRENIVRGAVVVKLVVYNFLLFVSTLVIFDPIVMIALVLNRRSSPVWFNRIVLVLALGIGFVLMLS